MAKAKKSIGLKKYQVKGTVTDSTTKSKMRFSDFQNAAKNYKSADEPSGGFKPKPRPYDGVPVGRPGKSKILPGFAAKSQMEALKKGGSVKKRTTSVRKKK